MRSGGAAALAALALVLAATGCGGDAGARAVATAPPRDACAAIIPSEPADLPATLPRPSGRIVIEPVRVRDGLTQVFGFVARAPGQAIADVAALPGMRVLDREEERADAEITVTDGRTRTLFKFVRACTDGSRFSALLAVEPR